MLIDMSRLITAEAKASAADEHTVEAAKAEARALLAATDWMAVREVETKKKMPAKIKAARAAARELL